MCSLYKLNILFHWFGENWFHSKIYFWTPSINFQSQIWADLIFWLVWILCSECKEKLCRIVGLTEGFDRNLSLLKNEIHTIYYLFNITSACFQIWIYCEDSEMNNGMRSAPCVRIFDYDQGKLWITRFEPYKNIWWI